ncbi:MAG: GIY-YIG nuclease family protein [Ignavibacteria bacterium]|nr:GIY-YIG nuclease family protein [Ignavibacteria bacterium]
MNYYTYIIQSESTGKLYIGQTNNLHNRLLQHNSIYL